MKILVIPDIHENLVFLKYILGYEKVEEFDKIVCLGDYFDPPQGTIADDQNLQQLAGTLMGLKEIHGDRLHLICGNHDQPYYAIKAAFAKKGEGPEKIACNWLPQTTVPRAVLINRLWDEEFWRQLEVAVLLDGWLFSHTGIDFAQGAYAIVEDGDVQLRIWPQSWLGEDFSGLRDLAVTSSLRDNGSS